MTDGWPEVGDGGTRRTAADGGADVREQFRPDDHSNDHFLLTTVVGSYPKPKWLNRAEELVEDDEYDFGEDHLTEAHDDAARLITREHERAGLDVVVDGEMRRNEMVEYFAHRIDGYEFNEHYDDEETLAYEVADLVNEEVEALVEAGARYIQIDEPALATTPDDHAIVGECLERIVEDVPADVRLGLHVCYGDYSRIYPEVLDFPVHEFDLELANGEYEQVPVFQDPEFTKDLALGVVDAHTAEVEPVEVIKENIKKGFEIVPPERLTISPDCGLKLLPRDVAYGKTRNMVQAVREVEAELDAGEIDVGFAAAPADD